VSLWELSVPSLIYKPLQDMEVSYRFVFFGNDRYRPVFCTNIMQSAGSAFVDSVSPFW
jgi:hypothetical protein